MGDVKIKICGLKRKEDIRYVNEAQPDACGFIIHVDKSIRNTTPDQVRALTENLSDAIVPVGVFVNEPVQSVSRLVLDHTIKAVQLHGGEDEAYIQKLRSYGTFPIIKAFPVPEGKDEQEILRWQTAVEESTADLVLIDQGGGGTGRTFDWSFAKRITRPYFLAGGIGPDNVLEALEELHPWGVDLSSSVETDGKKDRGKILDVVSKVRDFKNGREGAGKSNRQNQIKGEDKT